MAELRAFVALSHSATMGEAATLIGRDATVLSRRLQSLERRLGVKLVRRNTRTVALTDEGRAYLDRVAPVLAALDLADAEVGGTSEGELSGRIRITVPTSFGRIWMAPILLGFAERHPGIFLHVDYSDRPTNLVSEGYDLAVRIGPSSETASNSRHLAHRRQVVCVARDHPAASDVAHPSDLARHGALCFSGRERQQWSFRDALGATASVSVPCVLLSNNADLLVDAAIRGLGVLNTNDWHAHRALEDGTLIELLQSWRQVDAGSISLVTPVGDPPARVQALSAWIADGLGANKKTE